MAPSLRSHHNFSSVVYLNGNCSARTVKAKDHDFLETAFRSPLELFKICDTDLYTGDVIFIT